MDRSQKKQLVAHMREKLLAAKMVVVVQQRGLSVAAVTGLRREMRLADTQFKVLKNTLARLAVEGTSLEPLSSLFVGPTVLALAADPISTTKVVAKFAEKNDKLQIVGAYFDGQILNAHTVKALAALPSLDELRARLLGLIMAPSTRIAIYMREPAAKIARVVGAYGAT